MRFRLSSVAVCLSLIAPEAQALSCTQANLASNFNWHQQSDKTFRLFRGTVKMVGAIPKPQDGKARTAQAVATGRFMGRSGLGEPQSLNLTVHAECAASWCGGFPSESADADFYFLEQTSKGDVLHTGPCDFGYREQPVAKQIRILKRCFKRGMCSDFDIQSLDTR